MTLQFMLHKNHETIIEYVHHHCNEGQENKAKTIENVLSCWQDKFVVGVNYYKSKLAAFLWIVEIKCRISSLKTTSLQTGNMSACWLLPGDM